MPIPVECRSCGHRLKAKDASAGKKIRCPECEEPIKVPAGGGGPRRKKRPAKKRAEPEYEFDEDADLDFGQLASMERRSGSLGMGDVEPCPECGEPVGKKTPECPHCEADLDEIRSEAKKQKKIAKRKKMMAESREGGLPKNFNQFLILGLLMVFAPFGLHVMLPDPLLPPAPADFREALTLPARLWKLPSGYAPDEMERLERAVKNIHPKGSVEEYEDGKFAVFGPLEVKGSMRDKLKEQMDAGDIKSFTFD